MRTFGESQNELGEGLATPSEADASDLCISIEDAITHLPEEQQKIVSAHDFS